MPIAILALVVLVGGGLYLASRSSATDAPRNVTPSPGASIVNVLPSSQPAPKQATAGTLGGLLGPMQGNLPSSKPTGTNDNAALAAAAAQAFPQLVVGLGGVINEASRISSAKDIELMKLRPNDLVSSSLTKRQDSVIKADDNSPAIPSAFRSSSGQELYDVSAFVSDPAPSFPSSPFAPDAPSWAGGGSQNVDPNAPGFVPNDPGSVRTPIGWGPAG